MLSFSSFLLFLALLHIPSPALAHPPTSLWRRQTIPPLPSYSDIFSCPATQWPPASIGVPLTPQSPDAELQAILAEVDPTRIQAIIRKLASYGTRHTLSSQTSPTRGVGAARDWIAEQMRSFAAASGGRMEVTVPSYIQGVGDRILFPVRISNVVATLKGNVDPGRVYVVSGHYDTRCSDPNDYESDAPGADDECGFSPSSVLLWCGDILIVHAQCVRSCYIDGTCQDYGDEKTGGDDRFCCGGGRRARSVWE